MARSVPHASLNPAPWKNGGGSTTEIAIAPSGALLDNFDWRVSLATISQSGPFSLFPGIDRTLALVSGNGVTLEMEGARRFVLCARDPLIEFSGEATINAIVGDGVTTDFNVMTRRARCRHQFERRDISGNSVLVRRSGTTLLFLADGERLSANGATLGRFDALILGPEDAINWTLEASAPATLFIVDIISGGDL